MNEYRLQSKARSKQKIRVLYYVSGHNLSVSKKKKENLPLTKVTKMGTVYSGNFCPNSNGTQKCRNKISEILQYGQFHLTTEDSQILNRNFDKMESAH